MKYLIFCLGTLISTVCYSQKLELINVDDIDNLPLGQGLKLELRLKIDEVKMDRSKYELVSEPSLTSKFIVIPKDTGKHEIGPIISGNLISNSVTINVVPIVVESEVYITLPDSGTTGNDVKLIVTNVSKSEGYTIKGLKMKASESYKVIEQSFSMSVVSKEGEQTQKETLTFLIRPTIEGKIVINTGSFNAENIEGFSLKEKVLYVTP